jgi:P-type Ca2+ transporter type 2C
MVEERRQAMNWHERSANEVVGGLSRPEGLTTAEARQRLVEHGPNVLTASERRGPLAMFLAQFRDFMILVLLAAATISGLVGDLKDTMVITVIVLLNAVLGFVQEYRAERAVAALRALAAPTATVLRDGQPERIPAASIVPGDMVLLEAGAVVPADLRLTEAAMLKVDEAALTGESVPVEKTSEALRDPALPVAERRNLAYKGTVVTYGRGQGVAVTTGMATEFGKIATMLEAAGEVKTPLQRRLAAFGRRLTIVALAICGVVFVTGIARGEDALLMFMTAVSLAVAAIPEALPAVVAITLALGARKMVAKHALIRRLPAVETLGSVTYICSDKTGTLTLNRMRVEEIVSDGVLACRPAAGEPWDELLRAMALSNDATPGAEGLVVGDPTEVALLIAAREAGADKLELERCFPRVAEIPFDSDRKCMTTVHRRAESGFVSFTKGAVEVVLARSTQVATPAGPVPIRADELLVASERMATEGLRVLAVAARHWPAPPPMDDPASIERELTVLGLVGLLDPPREEARDAVETCRQAGIVPVMITGDHPLTARAIARRLGIVADGGEVLTGRELASLHPEALAQRVGHVRVYARVAPEQKLRIVQALQKSGEIVAMTGDGVNDAPALKHADIGVAMGITGTDVSKEASAMVLLDDNFATIVRAVREGRKIYDNIRRFVKYALTTNSAEVWTIFLAPFLGFPIPLLPIHILWINLVTDGLPGLALAAEPAERDVMRRPPRPPQEGVFAHGLGSHVVWVGVLMAALALGTEAWFFEPGSVHWRTMVFTVLTFSQLAHVLAVRSARTSLFTQGLLSNAPLTGAVTLMVALQLAVLYVPALNEVFATEPLNLVELAAALSVSSLVFVAVEIEKCIKRTRARRDSGAPLDGTERGAMKPEIAGSRMYRGK